MFTSDNFSWAQFKPEGVVSVSGGVKLESRRSNHAWQTNKRCKFSIDACSKYKIVLQVYNSSFFLNSCDLENEMWLPKSPWIHACVKLNKGYYHAVLHCQIFVHMYTHTQHPHKVMERKCWEGETCIDRHKWCLTLSLSLMKTVCNHLTYSSVHQRSSLSPCMLCLVCVFLFLWIIYTSQASLCVTNT